LASSSEDLRLSFKRSGGLFAGNRLELEIAGSDLDADEQAAWAEASAALEGAAAGAGEPPMGADEYQYDLSVRTATGEQSFQFTESTVPPGLSMLTRLLEKRAEGEVRRRSGR
jgi:hypothetical protein